MWGEQDRFAGVKTAERFHAELGGSELTVLSDAGHFVWDDEPERAAGLLVDFLARRLRR
jgi:pimeloyl-ACP methyl ester carboxylesterase